MNRNSKLLLLTIYCLFGISYDGPLFARRFLSVIETANSSDANASIGNYTQDEIEYTAPHLQVFHPRLLVWSEEKDFRVYNLDHKTNRKKSDHSCGRCAHIIPLLVHALKSQFPNRFKQGQPVFQLLWSDADSFHSVCARKENECHTEKFAPMPFFGSVLKDPTILPTVKAFPNWFYITCLYNWKFGIEQPTGCWDELVDPLISWDNLVPTVIWRGSDFNFLAPVHSYIPPGRLADLLDGVKDERKTSEAIFMNLFNHWDDLLPRWKAAALSIQAERKNETWIDVKFVGPIREGIHNRFSSRGIPVSTNQRMDAFEMSRYRYQLDLGGGGGTSWRGTISKLAMPGVLLHHETPAKDWFYDLMKPYEHYIPVHLDLVDLKAKYEWAEATQERAQEISAEGGELVKYLFSHEYMEKLYDDLFVHYLGKIVKSFNSSNATWKESYERYVERGFNLTLVSSCRGMDCVTDVRDNVHKVVPHFSPILESSELQSVDTLEELASEVADQSNPRSDVRSLHDTLQISRLNVTESTEDIEGTRTLLIPTECEHCQAHGDDNGVRVGPELLFVQALDDDSLPAVPESSSLASAGTDLGFRDNEQQPLLSDSAEILPDFENKELSMLAVMSDTGDSVHHNPMAASAEEMNSSVEWHFSSASDKQRLQASQLRSSASKEMKMQHWEDQSEYISSDRINAANHLVTPVASIFLIPHDIATGVFGVSHSKETVTADVHPLSTEENEDSVLPPWNKLGISEQFASQGETSKELEQLRSGPFPQIVL